MLSFETINKLKLFFECGVPMPQDAGTPSLSLLHIFNLYIISIAVLENVPPTQGYRKESPFMSGCMVPGIKPRPPAWQAASQDAQPSTTTYLLSYLLAKYFLFQAAREIITFDYVYSWPSVLYLGVY
jgi:hypothetical protein